MAHFYNCEDSLNPEFEPKINTPHQAKKKSAKIYPSVTTVLGIIKDDFLDSIYKPRMMYELTLQGAGSCWQEIERLTYGTRTHPDSGEQISSSEFGTSVHETIEDMINSLIFDEIRNLPHDHYYDDWGTPFYDWVIENNVKPVACEKLVTNNRIKIAGSIDFIGYDDEGTLFLAEYKCRTNTKGKAKTYAKDCEQLAIESYMLMKQHKLDYLPSCRSVIIDCETKEHIHREWTEEEMKWGIQNAKDASRIYWNKRMKPKVK